MIQTETRVNVTDNSGAKEALCLRVIGGTTAQLGEKVIVVVKKDITSGQANKSEIHPAVIVRQVKPFRRKDGSVIKFSDNAVVLINKEGNPIGSRVFGAVAREVRDSYMKIASLAVEVV